MLNEVEIRNEYIFRKGKLLECEREERKNTSEGMKRQRKWKMINGCMINVETGKERN